MQSTLADMFVAERNPQLVTEYFAAQMRAKVHRAHKFVLDSSASECLADMMTNAPEFIARNQEFVRAPYDLTWIEYDDFKALWKSVNQKIQPNAQWVGTDDKMGYLIEGDDIYSFVGTDKLESRGNLPVAMVTPWKYTLHRPMSVNEQLQLANLLKTSRIGIDEFMWGSIYYLLNEDDRRSLRTSHSMEILPILDKEILLQDEYKWQALEQCRGDFRNIVTILLLLTRPKVLKYVQSEKTRRGLFRNKPRIYHEYHKVQISLSRPDVMKEFAHSDKPSYHVRRHDVRGYWCHNKTTRTAVCDHIWIATNEFGNPKARKPDRYLCSNCGGKRWWKDHFTRGSSFEGFAQKDYVVKG